MEKSLIIITIILNIWDKINLNILYLYLYIYINNLWL